MQRANVTVIEPLGPGDVVAFAQCAALDVTVFPHASIPPLSAPGRPPPIWLARAQRGGAVIGFVAGTVHRGWYHVVGMAVAPDHRRRGVGRALLRAAIADARARPCAGLVLEVSTANRAAIELYAGEGFERVTRLEGYYAARGSSDGGDAWRMLLRLDER